MKKTFLKSAILSVILLFFSGCNMVETMKSNNANIINTTRQNLNLKKTGIPECDEIVDVLAQKGKGNVAEESLETKAMTELVKQQIKSYVNDGAAGKSPKDKADLAEKCKTALSYMKNDSKK
ncbi:MAG: hypothetical protein ACR2L1_01315 [Pyrinomonadaceae bacterium]